MGPRPPQAPRRWLVDALQVAKAAAALRDWHPDCDCDDLDYHDDENPF